MSTKKYELRASPDYSTFQFTSTGPKKSITKRIEYASLDYNLAGKQVYNLAFGDTDANGNIDDRVESNNGDLSLVMSTVVASIYEYTSAYPERLIYFQGSTDQRTKFYQSIMRRHYPVMAEDFFIFGIIETKEAREIHDFDLASDYCGFLVLRKLKD